MCQRGLIALVHTKHETKLLKSEVLDMAALKYAPLKQDVRSSSNSEGTFLS